ncbi:MAG TPA: hypothetical protein VFI76_07870, partial [Terrimicrobiaceae bacterium]|nr:hypothetical protein [Terrimicrobiaceae bacterium]
HREASLLHEREMGARSGARLLEIFDRLKNGFLADSPDDSPSASPSRYDSQSVTTPAEVLPRTKNGSEPVTFAEGFHKGILRVYDHLVLPFRFDEQYYRQAHPTAAQALAKGEFREAIEHYQKVGRKLGLRYARPRGEWMAGSPRENLRDVPVALFLFNRPALTKLVFARISEFAPTTLLLIADGPRSEGDAVLCNRARAVTESVDWPCRVLRNFAPRNLGCKLRVSSGLDWVFANVDEAIILEDDCLPDATFFPFCSELLARYRNDASIMHISGSCFLPEACTKDSYWFSKHSDIWGWATWRRAFRHYDVDLQSWPSWRGNRRTTAIWKDPFERDYWSQRLERIHRGELDTWDYQWHWAVYRQQGLAIVPRCNLVTNLGHGQQATHTSDERCPLANLPTVPLEAKLNHPRKRVSSGLVDKQFFLARYVLSRRIIHPHIPVPVAIEPQRVIVAHDAPTPAQGVGALLCKVMRHENDWISIRSRDCYLEHELPTRSFRVDAGGSKPNRLLTFKQIIGVLGNTSVSGILAAPFSEQDCLNATAVHALYNAPLAVWLMDDQNIFSPLISDAVFRELLERATVRLAICEALKDAYQQKFGFPFQVQPPVENAEDLVLNPLEISCSKRQGVVGCGNIWCEETLRRLMVFAEKAPFEIDWYGNLGQPRKHISNEELFAHNIRPKGFLPHASLIARLREYYLAIVPSPTDENPGRAWQSKLSFPSKLITLSYAANLPVLYIGSLDEPGARFVRERDLGEVVR